jgi:FtsP/CotA-like multicopper oxidase with cupredoxin domain
MKSKAGVASRSLLAAAAMAALSASTTALASATVPQTWLPGECIPQFVAALPVFGPGYNAALPRVDAARHPFLQIKMVETERQVLPPFTPAAGCPSVDIRPTRVWAYETSDWLTGKLLGPAFWPSVTLETRRNVPLTVKFVNALPRFGEPTTVNGVATTGFVQGLVTVDQTIHWTDPLGLTGPMACMMENSPPECWQPYLGSPPAVVHLHGGEVPSVSDGGPESWFTPDGKTGPHYSTVSDAGPGTQVNWYPNSQEAGTPWIHDHALGQTRTNVYSGFAAFYFIRDPAREPKNLPSGAYEVEMAIQDRQFDTNGQLYFPDGSGDPLSNLNGTPPNPAIHPFWVPEFIGDTAVVNGTPWPRFQVEPRRYRFRIIEGSNARFYDLDFGAPTWVIGADDGYLDSPVKVSKVFIAPGERADIIVDFTRSAGKSIVVTNDANVPYPVGASPLTDQPQMASIMRFDVSAPLIGTDGSCNPKTGGCGRPATTRIPRLTDGHGRLAGGVKIDKLRQLVLKEQAGFDSAGVGTGPLQVLVNNSRYDGLMSAGVAADFPTDGVSELPRVGSTELWEIINLTMDAHPMHTHLAQFQILSRQSFGAGYPDAWAAAFFNPDLTAKCGTAYVDPGNPCPGYGPPNTYGVPNGDGAIGGNPAVSHFLLQDRAPPAPEESGWKDTAKALPGQVLRIVVRFAPTTATLSMAQPGKNLYPFDPTRGPGYVWHCHIIDHEDNDMMRPYRVVP